MTVWGKNQDVPEKQDKYNIVVLEIDCDKKLADNPKLPRNSYLVTYMTCLLYTSPSPRDVRSSRMPSSA